MSNDAYIPLNTSLVNHLVDIIRRNTRLQFSRGKIQHLPRKPTHLPHPVLLLLIQNRNIMPTDELLLRAREPILRIVRVGDRLRDSPGGRQGVDRTEGAGELEGGEWIVLAGSWIRFRNDLWRKQAGEEITLRFVYGFVFALTGNQYGSV